MLDVLKVKKVFNPGTVNEKLVLNDLSIHFDEGDFVTIIGSNGAGKSTLLNCVAGVYPLDGGDIRINGTSIRGMKDFQRYRKMGRVYQDPSMGTCPHMTILENMSLADHKGGRFGLTAGVNRKREAAYREMLASLKLGLEDKMNVQVGSLSGGQRQAVALLMATLTPLDFLILDEHTAALDPRTAEIIMQLTDRIVREKKLTAIMVTHNLRYAVEYGTRLLMMDKGHIVLDRAGDEKKNTQTEDILHLFNQISIECGN